MYRFHYFASFGGREVPPRRFRDGVNGETFRSLKLMFLESGVFIDGDMLVIDG